MTVPKGGASQKSSHLFLCLWQWFSTFGSGPPGRSPHIFGFPQDIFNTYTI